MNFIPLRRSYAAHGQVNIAHTDGKTMHKLLFLVDTGATHTTIPRTLLENDLGYTSKYINDNKILLPENERPLMENGERADVYKIPINRINIGGHEIHLQYVLSSDTVNLISLLGLDVLSYFKFTFDFDDIDTYAPYGKMLYEFRESRRVDFTKMGEPFAYKLGSADS